MCLPQWHDANATSPTRRRSRFPTYDDTLLLGETCLFADWFLPQVAGKEKAARCARNMWRCGRRCLDKRRLLRISGCIAIIMPII